MQGKSVIITGGNDGIGKATAIGIARTGAYVAIVARNEKRGQDAVEEIAAQSGNSQVELFVADLASRAQVRSLAERIQEQFGRLDVLINNAGVYMKEREVTEDGFEATFAINHLSHFLLTNLLLPLLEKSAPARIINVSSMTHAGTEMDFSDLNMEKFYDAQEAYSRSKLANVLFTYELAQRLDPQKVTVNALHPGVIQTKLLQAGWGNLGNPSLVEGAATSIYLATSDELQGISGKYFSAQRQTKSSPQSYSEKSQRLLWQLSAKLTGLN